MPFLHKRHKNIKYSNRQVVYSTHKITKGKIYMYFNIEYVRSKKVFLSNYLPTQQ